MCPEAAAVVGAGAWVGAAGGSVVGAAVGWAEAEQASTERIRADPAKYGRSFLTFTDLSLL
jgi:hypothetical protein